MIEIIRGFMDGGLGRGWPPEVINAMPIPQLLCLFGEHAPDAGEYMTADEQVAMVNQKRAEMGLPPVQKRPRTFTEAARRKRELADGNGAS